MNEDTQEKLYSDMQQENADIRRREALMERLQIRDLDDALDQLSTALNDCERLRRLWKDTQGEVAKLRAVLADLENAGTVEESDIPCCPYCGVSRGRAHHHDCSLAIAIGANRKEEKS